MTPQILYSCIVAAANLYNFSPTILYGIYTAEQGKVGYERQNDNGSYDLGVMQINTVWVPELSKHWNLSEKETRVVLRDDGCLNIKTAAWILKQQLNKEPDLIKAIGNYHSKTPRHNKRYRSTVLLNLKEKGLLK